MSWSMHPSDSGFMSNYSEVPSDPEPTRKPGFWWWELSMKLRVEVRRFGSQAVQEGRSHLLAWSMACFSVEQCGHARLLIIRSRMREAIPKP